MSNKIRFFVGLTTASVLSLCISICSFAGSKTEAASIDRSEYLRYNAQRLTWDAETITLKGYFENVSDSKDVYGICDASIDILDADGNAAISTTMNSHSLSSVCLGPGEKWNYTIIRELSGFDPDNYNIKEGFSTSVSCAFSTRSHSVNCSYCSARTDTSFQTEDTMSEAEWQLLKAKLAAALNEGTSSEQNTGSSGGGIIYDYPTTSSVQKRTCTKCGGSGRITCTSCNGRGSKEQQERAHCLILHHPDCPGTCHGSCHKRHDYYTITKRCIICDGKGTKVCTTCHGTGSY